MEEGTSYLVWAERFTYDSIKSVKDGTYRTDGSKTSKGSGLVVRSYATQRNLVDNNEVYVFDEEKTSELMLIRQENINKQAEDRANKTVSTEDKLANAMIKAINKSKEPVESNEELEELIEKAEGLGIVLKGRKTIKSVQAKIDEKLSE